MYSLKNNDAAVELLVRKIQEKLSSIYCDTCRHYSDDAGCDDACLICHRNSMRWGINHAAAAELAQSLFEIAREEMCTSAEDSCLSN